MNCRIERLSAADVAAMWQINEEGLPGVGKVSVEAMGDLLSLAELPLGAYDESGLVGFVICLLPRTRYGSLNYAWFNERYEQFLYVDRIAIAERARNQEIGTALYGRVFDAALDLGWPVAAEVSLEPPNPGSERFHHRNGFEKVGVLQHEHQKVTMYLRQPSTNEANRS